MGIGPVSLPLSPKLTDAAHAILAHKSGHGLRYA